MGITKTNTNMMLIVLVSLAVIFSFGIGTVAADQSQIYVTTSGNDSWDGQSATWNGTSGPKLTIKNATNVVGANGTVYIANGTYYENGISVFMKSVNFVGESRDNTIINGTNTGRIFNVGQAGGGQYYTFTNLTFVNGNSTGGAIWNYGTTTITNCVFKNNTAPYSGGAIYSQGQGSFYAPLTITNSYFIGNKVTSGSGGAIYASYSTVNINNCDFVNNTATTGSAIYGANKIRFSRIIGTGNSLVAGTATDAKSNWWGSNANPVSRVQSGVDVSSWLVLTAPANRTLAPGSSSLIAADLQHDNIGNYYDPVNGHVPDGIPVTFAGDALGTVNPLSGTSFSGIFITNFTAGATNGVSNSTFIVDGVTVKGNVTIASVTPTNIVVDPKSGYNGSSVNLSAILRNGVTPINGQIVKFYVNGGYVGSATMISGIATLTYTIAQESGNYQILAEFLGNGAYSGSTGTNNLTVNYIPTNLVVNGPLDNYYRDGVNLTATLTNSGTGLANKIVYFNVNGNYAGVATTNGSGIATLSYTLTQGASTYQLLANFLGDTIYAANSATNSFTLIPTSTSIIVTPKTVNYNNSVQLTANLTDTVHGTSINGRTVTFSVNGTPVGSATTSNGMAYFTYTPSLNPGIYEILTKFAGDTGYITSSGINNLTISYANTTMTVNSASGYYNRTVSLTATLKEGTKNLVNKTINFSVNSSLVGSAVTNSLGQATFSYIATINPGVYQILAEFAGESGYLASNGTNNLTVNYNPTKLNVTAKSGIYNGKVNLTATLKDSFNSNIVGKTVYFYVNNDPVSVGSGTTDALGVATYEYTITQGAGVYPISAQFLAEGGYNASINSSTLTVSPAQSYMSVNPASGYNGDNVTLTASLWDINAAAIPGKWIDFYVNNVFQDSNQTDINGIATWIYTITQGAGVYPGYIKAVFAGDSYYNGITGFNTLTVIPDTTAPTVTANPVGGSYNATQNVVLTANEPATIYYTTDGSTPTESSQQYSMPIVISANTVLKFFAKDTAGNPSGVYNETYIIDTLVPTVTATPIGGTYNTTQNAVLTANEPATIYYTTDGSDPTTSSAQYTSPIVISGNTVLKFFAVDLAGNPSGIYNETYTIDVVAPTVTANPVGGLYNAAQNVVLTTNKPATIYYTTDGSNPTTSSAQYTSPIVISGNTVLKFFAVDLAGNPSGIYNETYTIDVVAPTVTANPVGGLYNAAQNVVLTTNKPATIYYTTDGSNPTTSSAQYTGPIVISGNTVLKFFAVDLAGNPSQIYNEIYTIDTIKPIASANVKTGLYNTNKVVSLSMSEPGTIYYTLNGGIPTTASTRYTGPITISSTTTLKFFAVDSAGNPSLVFTEKYTIDKTAPRVAATAPKNGATGVSRGNTIVIRFSENIKASTYWSKIYMKNLKTGRLVSFSKWISGNTLYIRNTYKRYAYTWYRVYIPGGAVRDYAGNNGIGYSFAFKTGRY